MEKVEKRRAFIINILYFAIILGAFYLFLKYAMGIFFPIIFSFILAVMLQRPANFLTRKTPLRKGISSVILVFAVLILLAALILLIGFQLTNYFKDFVAYIRSLFDNTQSVLETIKNWILDFSGKLPYSVGKIITKNVNEIYASLLNSIQGDTAAQTAEAAAQTATQNTRSITDILGLSFSSFTTPISSVVSTAMRIPSLLISVIIAIVMSCFLTSDYDRVTRFLENQFSDKRREDFNRAKYLLKNSFVKVLKAYVLIILITFAELSLGFFILKLLGIFNSKYFLIIAFITAVVDILPVLGTGTIIWPWAAYSLIVGDYKMAIGLVVIYIAITVIRQVIEPKLVAGQLGLPPFVTICAMFVGLKLFGVLGMILMPIVTIMVKLLNDEGIIHLWKVRVKAAEGAGEEEATETAEETQTEETKNTEDSEKEEKE